MAEVIETTDRSISLTSDGGLYTAQRSFSCAGYANEEEVTGQFGGVMPNYGEVHPYIPHSFATEFTLNLVSGHNDLWTVVWTYKQYQVEIPDFGISPITPASPGYIELSSNISAVYSLRYVEDPTNVDAAGSATMDDAGDIGGIPKAIGGHGFPYIRVQMDYTVIVTQHMASIRWDNIRDQIGDRNSSDLTFNRSTSGSNVNGFKMLEGTSVFIGANTTRIAPDVLTVTYKFKYDKESHLIQRPLRNITSNMDMTHANMPRTILHIQPYPNTSEFRDLCGAF